MPPNIRSFDHGKESRDRQKASIDQTTRRLRKLREDSEELKNNLTIFADQNTLDALLVLHGNMLTIERCLGMNSFDTKKLPVIREAVAAALAVGEFPALEERFRSVYNEMRKCPLDLSQCVNGEAGDFEMKLEYARNRVAAYSRRYKSALKEKLAERIKKMVDLTLQFHRYMLKAGDYLEANLRPTDQIFLVKEELAAALELPVDFVDPKFKKQHEDMRGYALRAQDCVAGVGSDTVEQLLGAAEELKGYFGKYSALFSQRVKTKKASLVELHEKMLGIEACLLSDEPHDKMLEIVMGKVNEILDLSVDAPDAKIRALYKGMRGSAVGVKACVCNPGSDVDSRLIGAWEEVVKYTTQYNPVFEQAIKLRHKDPAKDTT